MKNRGHEILFLLSWLFLCWLGLQAVHELGHVLGAVATGGTVRQVVLHPLTISRTDLSANPHPQLVAWAGPGLGSLLPLLAVVCLPRKCFLSRSLATFFAGFCLIANGLYLGLGSWNRIGDAGDLLRHGASQWELWLFGVVSTVLGLLLWHRLGPRCGWSTIQPEITPLVSYLMLACAAGVGVIACLWG